MLIDLPVPQLPRKSETRIPVAWGDGPFAAYDGRVYREVMPAGLSIAEIVALVPNRPAGFDRYGVVCVDGVPVERSRWSETRPQAGDGRSVSVTLHSGLGDPGGGSGGGAGGKNVLGVIAAIALIALTSFVGAGGLGFLGSAFGAGAFGARLLAAGIGLVGSLAIAALTAPPAVQAQGPNDNGRLRGPASAAGNLIGKGATLPAVVGTHRIFPPWVTHPRVQLDGEDEVVTAVFALAGPHLLEDIEIGGVPVDSMEDVTVQTREGWAGDSALTLVTEQTYSAIPAFSELTSHKWGASATGAGFYLLADQSTPTNSLPLWHRVVSRNSPDSIELHFLWPQGMALYSQSPPGALMPMRIRLRAKGAVSWINLPEIMWFGRDQELFRRAVKIIWGAAPNPIPTPSVDEEAGPRPLYLWHTTQAQSGPTSAAWEAHSHFDAGSGDSFLGPASGGVGGAFNPSATALQNVALYDDRVEFYLDEDIFPKGVYEIEVKRGALIEEADFVALADAYTYLGTVIDHFYYKTNTSPDPDEETAPRQADQYDQVNLVRVVSVWNEHPIGDTGMALVAIEARNRSIDQVSVLASGYVEDWNGVDDWDNWTTTSNPVPHLRQVLAGALNKKPLVDAQLDDANLLAWRTHCATEGYTCNAILDGLSIADALNLIAGCGYARPYKSETWGVAVDKDQRSDDPVQIFTPRNMRNFRYRRALSDLPDHFIAGYRSAADNYEQREVIVYYDGFDSSSVSLPESVDYLGLVTESDVAKRARFDLRQGRLRATFYSGEVWTEHIVCRRGDLVGVQHDILSVQAGSGRVKEVVTSGGNVTAIVLDSRVPVGVDINGDPVPAEVTGLGLRLKDGTFLVKQIDYVGAETETLTISTPFTDPGSALGPDCLAYVGVLNSEYRRLIVADIQPGPDLTAEIVFVDEAPGLFVDTRYTVGGDRRTTTSSDVRTAIT